MSKEKLFKQLITEMAKDGNINAIEYELLLEKGKDLGLGQSTVDLLIKMELAETAGNNIQIAGDIETDFTERSDAVHTFKSAITRGGSVLTPDIIVVTNSEVTYKKRNKYLINVDTISLPISTISSVEVDTSLLGTDLVIKSYGAGKIEARKFTKSDALKIRKLIMERQGNIK